MAKAKRPVYVEPDDYFPKELRKQFGLGEYSEAAKKNAAKPKKTAKKTDSKTTKKK